MCACQVNKAYWDSGFISLAMEDRWLECTGNEHVYVSTLLASIKVSYLPNQELH